MQNWERNAAAVPTRALWVAVEVDEGDLVDEHAIAAKAIGNREIVGAGYREILIYDPRVWEVLEESHVPAAKGITRQGPNRAVHDVVLRRLHDQRELGVVYGHFPTHAYNRPVVPKMRVEYDHMHEVMRRVVGAEVAERDAVILVDANNQHLKSLHPAQVTLNSHPPDYMLAVPVPGHTVALAEAWAEPMTIEKSHQLRLATFQIHQASKR